MACTKAIRPTAAVPAPPSPDRPPASDRLQQHHPNAHLHVHHDPSHVWIPELIDRIAAHLPNPNQVPLCLRLVNTAAATHLRRRRDLKQLVGLHERWLDSRGATIEGPGANLVLAAAAGSPTADWADKLDVLDHLLRAAGGGVRRQPQALFAAAVAAGSEEKAAWLAERGCGMPADGSPYVHAAATFDQLMLCRLQHLGCSPGLHSIALPGSGTVAEAVLRNYAGYGLQVPWENYQFPEFPYPRKTELEQYPSGEQVREYVQSYARHFDLYRHILFSCKLISLRRKVPVPPAAGSGPGHGLRPGTGPGPVAEKRMSTEFHTSASAMSGANNDARRSGSASTNGFGPMAPRASAGSAATVAAGSGWGGHATSPPPHSTMGRRSFGTVFSSSAKRLFGQLVGGGGGAQGSGVHSSASAVTMPLQDGVAAGRPAVRGAGAGAIGGLNSRGGGSTTEQVARTFGGGAMQQPSPVTAGAAAAERMGGASNGGGAAPSGDGPDSAGARGPVSGSAGLSGSSSTSGEHADGPDGTSNTGAGSAQAKSSTAGATVNHSSKGGNLPTTRGAAPRVPPIPGQELYRGLQVHSKDFTDAAVAAGKEVLVVGAGKTAADIVTELTATSQASRVTLLYRRPHWPLPRAVGPVTIKSLAYTRLISSALLPYYYDAGPGGKAAAACLTPLRKAFWIRFMAKVNQTFGVKKTMGAPDRPICQDIWYSGQVLDAVKWPDVINNPKVQARQGEVEYFTPVSAVLRDGTELQPDIVLYATGYSNQYTFLEPDVRESINVQHDGVYLYRHVLVPGLPGLAFVGAEAEWLASALAGEVELPLPHAMAADVEAQMEWRRRTMPPHKLRGSSVMLYMQAYHDQLVRDMGAATHRKQPSFRHPFAECFEPYTALDYSDVFMRDPLKQQHHNVPLDPLAPSEIDEDEPKARAVDEQDTLYSLDALPPALQAFRRTRVRSDAAARPSTGGGILDAMEEYADEYDEAAGDSQVYSDTPQQQQYRISGVRGLSLATLLLRRRNAANAVYDVSSSRIEPTSAAVNELGYRVLPPLAGGSWHVHSAAAEQPGGGECGRHRDAVPAGERSGGTGTRGISYMPSGSTAFVAPTQALAVHPQPRGTPAAAQSQRQGHAHVAHPQDPRREYLQNVVEHVQGRSVAAGARNTDSGGGGATESDAPGGGTRNCMSSGLSYVPAGSSFGPQPTLQLLPHYQVNIVDNTGSASTASAFGAYNTSGSTKLGYVSGSSGAGVLYANGNAVGGANHHGNGNGYTGGGVHMPVVHERRLSGASYASSGYSYMPSCSTVVPPQLAARS
eukprot:XP_001698221.1 predicted protein [Chlamydomonas reinhardtii]